MRAQSRYKQIRFTFTEEAGGVSWRIMMKPLTDEWTARHTVAVGGSEKPPGGFPDYESVLAFLIGELEARRLPPAH